MTEYIALGVVIAIVLVVVFYPYLKFLWVKPKIHLDPVGALILDHNNSVLKGQPVFFNPVKDAIIHKIDEHTAAVLSIHLQMAAIQYKLPLTYLMACVAIESAFDPMAENGNRGPGETNTQNDPLGYDVGLCQLKLRYIMSEPGVHDALTARAFALDVVRALPYQCRMMNGNLAFAQGLLSNPPSGAAPDARMKNEYVLATNTYNFGRKGVTAKFCSGEWPPHGQEVVDLEKWFAQELKLTSVFSGL